MTRFIKISVFFMLLLSVVSGYSQKEHPESILDMGIGVGPNYGIIGTKTVIGHKGTGLMLGAGGPGFQVGVQFSQDYFFANIGFGISGNITLNGSTYLVNGTTLMTGGKINLTQSRRLFLELGAGLSKSEIKFFTAIITKYSPRIGIGLNYRIGGTSIIH